MNDGTALNASDPNSMRDQGMTRNAQYVVKIRRGETTYNGKQHAYNRFLPEHRDQRLLNKTFYSFGGSGSLEKAKKMSKDNPYMGSHFQSTVEDQRRSQT